MINVKLTKQIECKQQRATLLNHIHLIYHLVTLVKVAQREFECKASHSISVWSLHVQRVCVWVCMHAFSKTEVLFNSVSECAVKHLALAVCNMFWQW